MFSFHFFIFVMFHNMLVAGLPLSLFSLIMYSIARCRRSWGCSRLLAIFLG